MSQHRRLKEVTRSLLKPWWQSLNEMKQKNEILVGAVEETAEIINLKEGQGMQNGLSIFKR